MPQGGGVRPRGASALGQSAAAVVGLAFYWKYYRTSSLTFMLSGYAGYDVVSPALPYLLYYLLLLALTLAALSPRVSSMSARTWRGLAVCLGLLASLCLLCPWARLAPAPSPTEPMLLPISLCLLAAALVASTAVWARLLAAWRPGASPLFIIAISMLLNLALYSADSVSHAASNAMDAAAPALSALCLAFLTSKAAAEPPAPRRQPDAGGSKRGGSDTALFASLACMLALAILAREFSGPMLRDPSIDNAPLFKNLVTIMELALVALFGLFGAGRPSFMRYGWLALAAVFLCALLVLALSGSEDNPAGQVALVVLFSMSVCFEMYALMLAVAASPGGRGNASRSALVLMLLPEAAAHAAGQAALLFLPVSAARLAESSSLIGCVLGTGVAACVFCFASSLAFRKQQDAPGREPASGPAAAPAPAPQASDDAVEALAREAGLTARERDMVRFLARGYSNKRIAEECCISLNTVQTHVQNCYRKLGVHTRDELAVLLRDVGDAR